MHIFLLSSSLSCFIQIVSKELGVPQELIYTSDSNTKTTPNSVITAASMGTDIYGPAVTVKYGFNHEKLSKGTW